MKKILTISIVVIILSFFIYVSFSNRDGGEVVLQNPDSTSPFGSGEGWVGIPATNPSFEGEAEALEDTTINAEARVFRISNQPVAGFVIIGSQSTTSVRFIERATGHIFETTLPGSTSTVSKKRLTNTTIPKIYEALFRPDGNAVVIRTLEEDTDFIRNTTLLLTPPKATSTEALYEVGSINLRANINQLTSNGNTLYYTLEEGLLGSSSFNGETPRTITNTSFNSFIPKTLGSSVMLQTKADSRAPGFVYRLINNNLSKVVGPLNNLLAKGNPTGNRILYSFNSGGGVALRSRNLETGSELEINPTALADKCVWSSDVTIFYCASNKGGLTASDLGSWYRGEKSFSDYIYRFDTNTEMAELIVEPIEEFGLNLDVYKPSLSPRGEYFVFINKMDLSLWALKLN